MGCDIHPHVEIRDPVTGKWAIQKGDFGRERNSHPTVVRPFKDCNYGVFAFLTGTVRNDEGIHGITLSPRRLPEDSPLRASQYEGFDQLNSGDDHSHSWLTFRELSSFDYHADVKYSGQIDTNRPAMTYRKFLGKDFFSDLLKLQALGALDDVRVVFWFDS